MTNDVQPTVAGVVGVLEQMYDPAWAREWDAVGLVCGEPSAQVRRVLLAVDPAPAVIEEALTWRADLLLTHHPLLFRPVHTVAAHTPKGRVIHQLVRHGCALYTAHTNADVAAPGVSDALARVLGLTDLVPLGRRPGRPDGQAGHLRTRNRTLTRLSTPWPPPAPATSAPTAGAPGAPSARAPSSAARAAPR